eukprot:scaffold1915_cov288-Prasinococcus_capsulatus_cf.AAC.11
MRQLRGRGLGHAAVNLLVLHRAGRRVDRDRAEDGELLAARVEHECVRRHVLLAQEAEAQIAVQVALLHSARRGEHKLAGVA